MTSHSTYKKLWYIQNRERILKKRKEHYLSNKEKVAEANRQWVLKNREKSREIKRRWQQKKAGLSSSGLGVRKYRSVPRFIFEADFWIKREARVFIRSLVKRGVLKRPSQCSNCTTNARLEGHHHKGYAKENWLDVIWLCKPCHDAAHGVGQAAATENSP